MNRWKSTCLEPGDVLRDVIILWLLDFLGGMLAAILARGDATRSIVYLFISSKAAPLIAFFLIGCLVGGWRWKHLLAVAVAYWLACLANLTGGIPFAQWLVSLPMLLVLMLLGGGLSCVARR